mmetsp:Transcript_27364/g.49251  ORF Transcript_27364/g.49251 Transcript_27364/m.49251 type:complete len:771 (-) Transcript_27364:140-2452(-)
MTEEASKDAPLIAKTPEAKKGGFCASLCRCLCCCFVKKAPSNALHPDSKSKWGIFRRKAKKKINKGAVYLALLDLYAHSENGLEELSGCRLDPDFDSNTREDLEFYIPQLVNFLLYGEHEHLEELLKYVLESCKTSFFFAHRVLWFLNSTNFAELEGTTIDPLQLIKSVQIVCRNSHSLYVGLNPELYDLLTMHNIFKRELDAESPYVQQLMAEDAIKKTTFREVMDAYDDGLRPQVKFDIKSMPIEEFSRKGIVDEFLGSMWFVEELTNIADSLITIADKKESLKRLLGELNQKLPSTVYVPLSKLSLRKSIALHIPVNEARVFQTNKKAPYLIILEVFDPFEEAQALEQVDPISNRKIRSTSLPTSAVPKFNRSHSFLQPQKDKTIATEISEGDFKRVMQEATVTMREDTTLLRKSFDSSSISSIREAAEEIEEEEVERRKYTHRQTVAAAYDVSPIDRDAITTRGEETQETAVLFKETSAQQAQRIKASSPFGNLKTWRIVRLIVKSGDDLRQEQLAMQLISLCKQIFESAKLDLYVRPYEILATGPNCGILECVPDAMSIDSLKKSLPPGRNTLRDFFVMQYGVENSKSYKSASKCFMRSLAAYSLICYILQIKDRHNGNILLDRKGHIVHIDFGFLLSNSPGGNIGFESAPFKLTDEFVDVLGGPRSARFVKFRGLCVRGYSALRRQTEKIVLLVEMLRTGTGATMPCFIGGEQAVIELRRRLTPRSKMSETDCRDYINQLIDESLGNWRTRWYDRYQYWCQNIL